MLDEVSRTTVSGNKLEFSLGNVSAYDVLTTTTQTPTPATVLAATINVVDSSTVNVTNNVASKSQLVTAGTNVVIGSVKMTAQNSTAVLKTLNVELSGGVEADQLTNINLYANNVVVSADVDKVGTGLKFYNMSYEIPAGTTPTFEVKADVNPVVNVVDLAGKSSLVTYYVSGGFETLAGDAFINNTGTTMSAPIEIVKSRPTVSVVSAYAGADFATYAIKVTPSNGELTLDKLVVALGNNLSGGCASCTVALSSDVNGGISYGTTQPYGATVEFTGINVSVSSDTTLYVTVKNVVWSATDTTPFINIGLKDFDYSDVLADGSVPHTNILTNFYSSVTSDTSLTRRVEYK